MKLRIDFGLSGARREVTWWQKLSDFPTAILFEGDRWEWIVYDQDPNKVYDSILTFGHMSEKDPRWFSCLDFDLQFGYAARNGCECGAIHTSAPQFHMFYCPQWRKQ